MTGKHLREILEKLPDDVQIVVASWEEPGTMSHAAILYDEHYVEITEDLDAEAAGLVVRFPKI